MAEGGESQVGPESLLGEFASVVYCQRTLDSRTVRRAGSGFEELTGYDAKSSEESLSWFGDVVHPDDRGRIDRWIEGANGAGFEGTYRIVRPDDTTQWVHERGRVVSADDGTRIVEGLLSDAEPRAGPGLKQYQKLVENVGDPMYILDSRGRIQLVNSELATLLGGDRDEIEGEPVENVLSANLIERAEEVIAELLSAEDDRETITWQVEMANAAGAPRPVQIRTGLIRDETGQFQGSAGVIRDITTQLERQRELERYETIIQAVGDPVYTLDADGNFRFVNDAFERQFGYSRAEIEGKHASFILDEEILRRSEQHIETLLEDDKKQAAKFEIRPKTKDSGRIDCELQMALLTHDGQFRGTAGVVRDITERKRREQRLEQFSSVVSHDLRGPLSSLSTRLELARQTDPAEQFDAMERAIGRMERLIDNLLTLAKQGDVVGDTRRVSLESVASRAWRDLGTQSGSLKITGDLLFEADAQRLQDILENLFRNAVEHGSTGSRSQTDDAVEHGSTSPASQQDAGEHGTSEENQAGPVSGDRARGVQIRVGTLEDSSGFFVADDGPGIEPERREEIFEHGYTTDRDGTGFGLSIVERIVDAHGWEISVTSSRDGGARFEIRTE